MRASSPIPASKPPPAPDPLVGTVIADRYHVLRVLGEGGMGVVYEAEQQFLGRTVALKTLHGMFARKPEIVARFQNEALAAAKVRNPHIVELLELGHLDDGALFIAMEMLRGQELAKLLREGPLPIGRAVRIAMQLCDALIDVHAAGIVHRDLKPANIFLVRAGTNEDFVKILDFGISKIIEADGSQDVTRTRSVLGTPHYMAPEQIGNARNVDARADLYALGGILYRALAGRTPFIEKDFTELAIQVKTLPPPDIRAMRQDLPEPLAQVIHACLGKSPDERPPDARALRQSIEPFAHLDDAPRLSAPPALPVGDLFASAPSRARMGVGHTVVTPAPPPPPPLSGSAVIHPGSLSGPIIVQSSNNGVMVLVSVLATVLVLGGLAIAAFAFVKPAPAAATVPPTTTIATPAAPQPSAPPARALPAAPQPAAPPAAPRPSRPPAEATAVRPATPAPRTRARDPRVEPPSAPALSPTPVAPPPSAPPPQQGVLVHAPIGSPF